MLDQDADVGFDHPGDRPCPRAAMKLGRCATLGTTRFTDWELGVRAAIFINVLFTVSRV